MDLELDIPDGYIVLLKKLGLNLNGAILVDIKFDGRSQYVNSGMVGTDNHINFEEYYGQPVIVTDNINVTLNSVSADVDIIARGLLIEAVI